LGCSGPTLRVVEFVALAYVLAFLVDYSADALGLTSAGSAAAGALAAVWGSLRMWSVALAVAACLLIHRVGVGAWFRGVARLSREVLLYYLLSPLVVYLALGVYTLVAHPLGLLDFGVYVEAVAARLRELGVLVDSRRPGFVKPREVTTGYVPDVEGLAQVVAVAQVVLAYVAATTVNALLALGEELGWRGYLYELLGRRPTLTNTVVIGACWGLWHAPAVLLLGYNYSYSRLLGVPLFTALTVALTYPHLVVVSRARSVLPACSLHGALNALWPLTVVATRLPAEQREVLLGLGALGILTWATVSAVLAVVNHVFRGRS
jgi:membrane protease YdiL (CAAX protease family)